MNNKESLKKSAPLPLPEQGGDGGLSTNSVANESFSVDRNIDRRRIIPYSGIPELPRKLLIEMYGIKDIDKARPDDAREMYRRELLDDIAKSQEYITTYCGVELNKQAYQAAALGAISDFQGNGFGSDENRRAGRALYRFFQENTPDDPYSAENVYVAGLLRDRSNLNAFRAMTRSSEDTIDRNVPPSREEWLTAPEMINPDALYKAVEEINIESILISGAEMLHLFNKHNQTSSRDMLDAIRYTEQILAPIAEVIGFDTLAMSLNSATKLLRLQNGGRSDIISKAEGILKPFENFSRSFDLADNVRSIMANISTELLGNSAGFDEMETPIDYGRTNSSVYGYSPEVQLDTLRGPVDFSWRFRLKTSGSLAWKLFEAEKDAEKAAPEDQDRYKLMPMDILAGTVVVESEEDQGKIFSAIVDGLYGSHAFVPQAAPSKISPVHIRGTERYIDSIVSCIDPDLNIEFDKDVSSTEESLHLCKITGFYGDLPFEVQCVTKYYRESMQTGHLAHIIYKNSPDGVINREEADKWVNLLGKIRSRRDRIQVLGLVGSNGYIKRSGHKISKNEQEAEKYLDRIYEFNDRTNRELGEIALSNIDSGLDID